MTDRTIQFWGQGFNTTLDGYGAAVPCTITATLNGNTVFSGAVPTIAGPDYSDSPVDQSLLFTATVPMDLEGSIPMTLTITGSDVYLKQILVNYCKNSNLVDPSVWTTSGPDGFQPTSLTDSRSNVVCTGATYMNEPPPEPRPTGGEGTWGWEVETSGSPAVFSYDLNLIRGSDVNSPA